MLKICICVYKSVMTNLGEGWYTKKKSWVVGANCN